jgi:hypothetical protein
MQSDIFFIGLITGITIALVGMLAIVLIYNTIENK